MHHTPKIYLAVSLDVEEEGLFCGRYQERNVTVANTAALSRLRPLLALGVRPTLFCAYSVLTNADAQGHLLRILDEGRGELAGHLHHWNTPPLPPSSTDRVFDHVPSRRLSKELFGAKLKSVLQAGAELTGTAVTSFRMGRWDLHREHWPILAQCGVLTDASVRPLHGSKANSDNPDHFHAPSAPYWIPTRYGHIFEVPLTVTPIFSPLSAVLTMGQKTPRCIVSWADFLKSTTNYWGALALLPAYHPLLAMKAVTRLYISRGGRLLSLTWHSSEMQPGATPHLPTERHVAKLLAKVHAYVSWLMHTYEVCCLPMNELRHTLGTTAPRLTATHGDWTVSEDASSW